jgi:hypothetical protein
MKGKWENGRMGKWENGRMGEWENGKMGKWQEGFEISRNMGTEWRVGKLSKFKSTNNVGMWVEILSGNKVGKCWEISVKWAHAGDNGEMDGK